MKLTHIYLANTLSKIVPAVNSDGVCYGLASMSMQAIIDDKLESFNHLLKLMAEKSRTLSSDEFAEFLKKIDEKRVSSIKKYKQDLVKKLLNKNVTLKDQEFYNLLKNYKDNIFVAEYYEKCANVNNELNKDEKNFIDMRAFLEMVALNFSPQSFSELFEQDNKPTKQDADLVLLLSLPDKLISITNSERESLVKKVKSLTGLYNFDELKNYFEQLKPVLSDTIPPVAFLLKSSNHALTVSYDSRKQVWQFIDANKLPIIECKTEAELAEQVLTSLSKNGITTFIADIYCHKNQAAHFNKKLSDLIDSEQWKKLHDIKDKEMLTDSSGASLFWTAAKAGDAILIKSLLENEKSSSIDINQMGTGGLTPFLVSILQGNTEVFNILLKQKDKNNVLRVNVNQATKEGYTPLYLAAFGGNLECVETLLDLKDNDNKLILEVKESSLNKVSPLYIAVQQGHLSVVRALLSSPFLDVLNQPIQASVKILLNSASNHGRQNAVKKLFRDRGISDNHALEGFTPLHAAVFYGHIDIVRSLLSAGADIYQEAQSNISVLDLAKAMNNKDVIHLLEEARISLEERALLNLEGLAQKANFILDEDIKSAAIYVITHVGEKYMMSTIDAIITDLQELKKDDMKNTKKNQIETILKKISADKAAAFVSKNKSLSSYNSNRLFSTFKRIFSAVSKKSPINSRKSVSKF